MNQLIAAVEVALSQSWTDIVTALTETARILQTYEDAGRAHLCVPFLAQSYEILSLMVGDLIGGTVRSGVVQKWRDLYNEALDDLNAAGLTLVSDEGPAPTPAEAEPTEAAAGTVDATGPMDESFDESFPFDMPPVESLPTEASIDELPALADLVPLMDEKTCTTAELPQQADEAGSHATDRLSPVEALGEKSGSTTGVAVGAPPEGREGPEQPGFSLADKTAPPKVVETLDNLCDGLARIKTAPAEGSADAFASLDAGLAFLERLARDERRTGAERLCNAMTKLCRLASERSAPIDDRYFELGYAFSGAYVEVDGGPDSPVVKDWINECTALMDSWGHEAREPRWSEEDLREMVITDEAEGLLAEPADEGAPETPSEVEGEPGAQPPEETTASLLQTAQRAVAEGNVADAKVFALRAAASIAKIEAAKAEMLVKETEAHLKEGTEAIAQAREEVREAEQNVVECEGTVTESKGSLAEIQASAKETVAKLEEVNRRAAELDKQIQELQAQRDVQAQLGEETRAALDEEREQQAKAQSELDSLIEAERGARVGLENARQNVKNLHHKRAEIEKDMEKARETLTRQRMSLADIEQTIAQTSGDDLADAGPADDLLF